MPNEFDPAAIVERLAEVTHEAWVRNHEVRYTAREAAIILAYQTAALDQGWVVEFEDESGSWQARPRQPGEF